MTAVIIISPGGKVTAANSLASAWWKATGSKPLVGRSFSDLFRFEIIVETDEDKEFHWKLLWESAESGPLKLDVVPDGGELFPVIVNLEEVSMEEGSHSFIATLLREKAVSSSLKANPETAENFSPAISGGFQELEEAEQIGFFSLEFPDGVCRYSATWKRLLGYEPDELPDSHKTFIKLTHPEDSEASPDQPGRGEPNSSTPFSVEIRMRKKSGNYVWMQSVGTQFYGPSGHLVRVTGFHLDIQERKEIELESLQNEERFLTLIRRGNLGFFDLDFRNHSAFFSPAWLKILGYNDGDLENTPEAFRRLIDVRIPGADDLENIFTGPAQENGQAESSFARELRMQRKDGEFLNLHTHIIRLTNRRGESLRVLGFQAQLHESALPAWRGTEPAILFAGLQAVNEAVILTDPQSKVLFFNGKAATLTGLDATEVLGRDLEEVLELVYSFDQLPAGNLADQVLASGNSILFSREFLLEQGGRKPRRIVLSCLPLRNSHERIVGTVMIFRDPSEMSLTPDELVKSNRMESLGLLASGVAHDFNNLLTSIVGGISLAREIRDWEMLDSSERACLSAKNLTHQLLTFSRRPSSDRKPLYISNLIGDCARLASSGSTVKPLVELPEGLYPVAIDPSHMSQVFQNLIINSIQEMGKAGGKLVISGENATVAAGELPELAPGDYLCINVTDSGQGIPKENLTRIFNPFFTTKKSGTGLGLSTVASIINAHGGRILVTSEVGKGTTFSVYLPKSEEPVEPEARRIPSFKFGTGRILFMDDDEEILNLAEGMLKRLEYEFDLVRNGEEAISLYRRYVKLKRPYDAVILDLTIVGGMGGEETFQELKKLDPDVRAIVSSGYNTEDSDDYYLNQGFYGVLAKPYRSAEMGKLLRHVLGKDGDPEEGLKKKMIKPGKTGKV